MSVHFWTTNQSVRSYLDDKPKCPLISGRQTWVSAHIWTTNQSVRFLIWILTANTCYPSESQELLFPLGSFWSPPLKRPLLWGAPNISLESTHTTSRRVFGALASRKLEKSHPNRYASSRRLGVFIYCLPRGRNVALRGRWCQDTAGNSPQMRHCRTPKRELHVLSPVKCPRNSIRVYIHCAVGWCKELYKGTLLWSHLCTGEMFRRIFVISKDDLGKWCCVFKETYQTEGLDPISWIQKNNISGVGAHLQNLKKIQSWKHPYTLYHATLLVDWLIGRVTQCCW